MAGQAEVTGLILAWSKELGQRVKTFSSSSSLDT